MLVEFVAPGVAAVRVETDVDTTAVLNLFGRPGEVNNTRPEEDKTLSKSHTISIPIVGIRPGYSVTVKDKEGRQGTGILERPLEGTDVVGTQFFGRGASRPGVAFQAGRKGTVIWTNLLGAEAPFAGLVRLYAKPNTCTRAQECPVTLVQTFTTDTIGGDKVSATHAVPIAFPDTPNVDFRVLVVGRERPLGTAARPLSYFYQLDVPAASVLK